MLPRASRWAKAALNAATQRSAAQYAHSCGLEGIIMASVILWIQSGHAQEVAARRYVELKSPNLLYSTWAAFKLLVEFYVLSGLEGDG